MEAEVTSKVKKGFDKKILKVAAIGLVIILVLGAAFMYAYPKITSSSKNSIKQRTALVTKGDISITVTGSGPVQSSNTSDVTPSIGGTITKVYFKEGDKVKAGDLMYELDDSNAQLNVANIQNQIAQAQLSQSSNVSSLGKLSVTAPFNGIVTNITAKEGDMLNKGAAVLTLVDQSHLKLSLPFSGSSIKSISTGQKATVYTSDQSASFNGIVTSVDSIPYSDAEGNQLYDVEITVDNPGTLKAGNNAGARISTSQGIQASMRDGTFVYPDNITVRSESGGTVKSIKVQENQYVKAGTILAELANDDLVLSTNTTDLKLQSLQAQLVEAQKQLGYCRIYSPIDGIIVSQAVKVGETAKAAEVMSTVSDSGHMEFVIPVDELDIAKIQVGQKANITVDALPDTTAKPLTGSISKVATQGTSSNGVTTYNVTVAFDNPDRLKVGMNANAEIIISNKANTLLLPVEAVQRMNGRAFVMVKGEPGSSSDAQNNQRNNPGVNDNRNSSGNGSQDNGNNRRQSGNSGNNVNGGNGGNGGFNSSSGGNRGNSVFQQYYANTTRKQIEVGISNETNIEVVSGLNEGDEVILPPLTQGQSSSSNSSMMQFGGGGGGFVGGANRPAGGSTNNNNNRNAGGNSAGR